MKKYYANELDEIERPYEMEYSSMKSSKNDSLKAKANKLKVINKNLLNINNNNNQINNQKNIFRNTPNLNSISSFKSLQNNNVNNNINFRLNEITKKKLENYMESTKNKFPKKNIQNNPKKQKQNKNLNKKTNNNTNIYSKVNNYWEIREKKNKIKMLRIKKEREDKIYGELYPKPKISKNTQEIIERLKERNYELTAEDEYEEEINRNIPIRTKEKNYFFKTVYYSNKIKLNKKNKKQINKSFSKINPKYKNNKFNLIQINNKKRAKTPKLKRYTSTKNKKSSSQKKLNFSVADIKNLEMIRQLRQKEEEEKIEEIENKIKTEENRNITEDVKINKKIIIDKELKNSNEKNLVNKSISILSMRNPSINLNYISNINEIMTSRKYLNELYNKDKKIINHSFILNSSTSPGTSNIKKININNTNSSSLKNKVSKTLDNKIKQKSKSGIAPKKNKNKNCIEYGLYDPNAKSLRYRHYTDISKSYNSYIKSNNTFGKKENNSVNKSNNFIVKSDERLFDINQSYIGKNKIKNNLCFEFDREINEKDEGVNQLYKKELKQKTNEINKIEVELKERDMINKKLINESIVNDKDFEKIVLKNESLNNKYNEINNQSLLKFREENLKKLEELRQKGQKGNNFDKYKLLNIKNEEEKNDDKQYNGKINTMKYKSILSSEQQNIENNLELYNNELRTNEQKKKALLNKLFSNDYKKSIALENDEDINNNGLQFGVNKYFVKNDLNLNDKFIYKYDSNKNEDMLDKKGLNGNNENIVENFEFERRHHF